MARLRKPGINESLSFIQRDGRRGYHTLSLTTYSDRATLWFERYEYSAVSDSNPDGFTRCHTFNGIKAVRKFAFAILDATGGRKENE